MVVHAWYNLFIYSTVLNNINNLLLNALLNYMIVITVKFR